MNYLDTRDLNKRLEELEDMETNLEGAQAVYAEAKDDLDAAEDDEVEDLEIALEEAQESLDDAQSEFDDDAEAELRELQTLAEEIPEWRHGETLIPEDEFPNYVQELCIDIGYLSNDFPPWIEIDWDQTAENVKADYIPVTYQGDDYLVRSC